MFCSISGEVPQEGVVSRKSGLLYERRLIEKAIRDTGKCPVSGTDLSDEDLIAVQASKVVKPRSLTATSIPGMLAAFQNEWDELVMENFTLKQHLDTTRQELSQALYQHDAACRVIGRLMRERDESRAMLAALQANGFGSQTQPQKSNHKEDGHKMEVETAAPATGPAGLGAQVLEEIDNKCKELSSMRKGRKPSDKLASKDSVSQFAVTSTYTPHKADKSTTIASLALHSQFQHSDGAGSAVVLSGSSDKSVVVTDFASGDVLLKLAGHTKKVSTVAFVGAGGVISGSADRSVKLWAPARGKWEAVWEHSHSHEVTSLAVHPTGTFAASCSMDGMWQFLDLRQRISLVTVGTAGSSTAGDDYGIHACAFHPDGLIFGTGTSAGVLKLWDIREQGNVANCAEGTQQLHSISFSENGYLVATGSIDGTARIWDLRKQACVKTFEGAGTSVAFDYSGTFLAIGGGGPHGGNVQVRAAKEWSPILELADVHSKQVNALAWGEHAHSLVSGGSDRSIKILSQA